MDLEVRMTHIKELIDKNMEFLIKNSRPEDKERLTKEWEKIKADIEAWKLALFVEEFGNPFVLKYTPVEDCEGEKNERSGKCCSRL